jgi:hypothetical protein
MITLKQMGAEDWLVTVVADQKTEHRVRVTSGDMQRFASGRSAEELLRASFEFLLEREPNTSILRSFDLPVIGRYFPEYEEAMKAI